jgi:hypothetical protein
VYRSKSVADIYNLIGTTVRYSDYTLTEIENLVPYELDIYTAILIQQIQKEESQSNG